MNFAINKKGTCLLFLSILCLSALFILSGCLSDEDDDLITDTDGDSNTGGQITNPSQTNINYVNGFAGTWDTNWGMLTFMIDGIKVKGVYEHDDGKIDAVLSKDGKTMEGVWGEYPSYQADADGGRVIFKLSDDGKSISGHWWYGNDQEGGDWTGTKVQGITQPTDKQVLYVKGFEGKWDTNWGVLIFKADGIKLHGTYEHDNGRIEAVLGKDGTTMEGTWGESPSYLPPDDGGRVTFSLSSDRNEINGYWWYGFDNDGGDWTGKRIQ